MNRYEVIITRTVKQSQLVTVDANDRDEAYDTAYDNLFYSEEWPEVDTDDYNVDSVELVEGEEPDPRAPFYGWLDEEIGV